MCLTGHVLDGRLDSFDLDEEGRLGSFLRPVVRTPSSFPPASALNWIFVFLCFAFSSRALLPPCRRPPLWIELVLFNTRPRLKNTPFFSVKVWKCESVKVWVWKCESVKHPPSSQDLFIWIDFGSKVWRILESTLSQTETWPSWQYFNFPSMEPNLQIGFEILGARERRSPKSKDTNWGQIGVEIPSNHFTVQQLWFFYLGAFTDTFTATWSHWKRKKMIANCRFQGWRCRMKPTCSISWGISLGARCSSEIPSHLVIWDFSPYSYIYSPSASESLTISHAHSHKLNRDQAETCWDFHSTQHQYHNKGPINLSPLPIVIDPFTNLTRSPTLRPAVMAGPPCVELEVSKCVRIWSDVIKKIKAQVWPGKQRPGMERTWEKPEDSGTSASTVDTNNSKTKPEIIAIYITIIVVVIATILMTCKDLQCLPCVSAGAADPPPPAAPGEPGQHQTHGRPDHRGVVPQ